MSRLMIGAPRPSVLSSSALLNAAPSGRRRSSLITSPPPWSRYCVGSPVVAILVPFRFHAVLSSGRPSSCVPTSCGPPVLAPDCPSQSAPGPYLSVTLTSGPSAAANASRQTFALSSGFFPQCTRLHAAFVHPLREHTWWGQIPGQCLWNSATWSLITTGPTIHLHGSLATCVCGGCGPGFTGEDPAACFTTSVIMWCKFSESLILTRSHSSKPCTSRIIGASEGACLMVSPAACNFPHASSSASA